MHINNTLTVRELRDLLAQFHDETPVMLVVNDSPVHIHTVNHAVEMGWKVGQGDSIIEIVQPTAKDRVGFMVGLR